MRKNIVKTWIIGLLTALGISTAVGGFTVFSTISSKAESQNVLQDTLMLPQSYQQYLNLSQPKDVAFSENYFAISDGNVIYIYDKAEDVYRAYTHNYYGEDSPSNSVAKLQFDESENLYFLDQHELFVLENEKLPDANEETASPTNFYCTTFLVESNTLYFTDMKAGSTFLYKTSINNLVPDKQNRQTIIGSEDTGGSGLSGVTLAFHDEDLYFTNRSLQTDIYKFNPSTQTQLTFTQMHVASVDDEISSMSIPQEGVLAYSTNANEFFVYSLHSIEQEAVIFYAEGKYGALCSFNEEIYAVNGNKVQLFSIADKNFTAYEIGANSSAFNRLDGATETCLIGNKLFISDNGNNRVLIYDTLQNTFEKAINSTLSPSFLSADENTLLLASKEKVIVYSLSADNYGAELFSYNRFASEVKGVACVYGKYYIATNGYVYLLSKSEKTDDQSTAKTQGWEVLERKKTAFFPNLFTADAYGNLYTVQTNSVFVFTEEQLLNATHEGEKKHTLSLPAQKMIIDYEQNAYILSGNSVYKIAEETTQTNFSTPLVYKTQTKATSFTFGIENNEAYLLFDGNYLIKTSRLNLPTVKNIPTQGVTERIFSNQSTQVEVVKTQANALFVEFDLNALQEEPSHFPYLSYKRNEKETTALKLDETDKYNLIALFDEEENKYFTYLVLKSACASLPIEEYSTRFSEEKTAWITNEVSLYKFPYLCQLLTRARLPRGANVKLLGEIRQLDHDYYLICYTSQDGSVQTGFIPQSYATLFNGSPVQPEENGYGETESDTDSVWRMAYLLLGFSIIAILVNFLILRKKNDD